MTAMIARFLAGALLALPLVVQAAPLKTSAGQSRVTATFWQLNVPVEAEFRRFEASIDYDAAKLERTRATMTIETASLDLGDELMNAEVGKPEWFDSKRHPKATFFTTSIKPAGPSKVIVNGTLTIKGRSLDVSFPLTIKVQGDAYVFDGQLPIRRTAFFVGEGDWLDTSLVADQVIIKFHIVASK